MVRTDRPSHDARTKLAVTMGDPAGIGPEIVARLLANAELNDVRILAIGSAEVLHATQRALGLPSDEQVLSLDDVESHAHEQRDAPADAPGKHCVVDVDDGGSDARLGAKIITGAIQPEAGELAYRSIRAAASLVMHGHADALVTAPINKAALQRAGHAYPGHTELLADLAGSPEVAMMMAEERLKVTLATIHVSLSDVPRVLTTAKIGAAIRLTAQFLKRLGMAAPRLAVAGLNPHAGEGGIFGREEETIIQPAIDEARAEGTDVTGPLPGDVVFHQAIQGRFDAVVAMYHDQGLIPVKLLGFGRAVNVTLGLPFLRTSVDHGTAFDIAGRGVADAGSLHYAARMAERWVTRWQCDHAS